MQRKSSFRDAASWRVLRFTWRHWCRQPVRIFVIVATVLVSTLGDVLTPLFSGRLVDAVASGNAGDAAGRREAFAAFATLMALALTTVVFRHFTFAVIVKLTLRTITDVAAEAFNRVQRFSSDWHANTFAGSTVRKITRGMWAFDLLNDTILVALLPSAVMLVGTTVVLGWHWPWIGLTVAIGSAIYLAMTLWLTLGYVAPASSLANRWDTRLGGVLADAITCNAVVKSFGAETREDERFARVTGRWRRRTDRAWMRMTVNGTSQNTALFGLRAAVIGLALLLWANASATPGDIAFVLTSFFVLQGYLREMGRNIANFQRSINDLEELVALHSEPLGVEDRAGAGAIRIARGEIVFDDVTFHYGRHATPLYRGLSVTIAAGERVGLVGHSGSGKTTFVKLIQRLYDVSEGQIMIDGQDVAAVTQASLRQQIAIVQQEPVLFHRSLADNIAYARPDAPMAAVVDAARLANADAFIERLPKGYATLVGERGVKLSGGERQRIALARAFLANAPVLILDEATSSLDSASELLIQEAMERLMVGRTTLVIAHRLSTVRTLDRILVFDRGRVVEEGDHPTLLRRPDGVYRSLFERQAGEMLRAS